MEKQLPSLATRAKEFAQKLLLDAKTSRLRRRQETALKEIRKIDKKVNETILKDIFKHHE